MSIEGVKKVLEKIAASPRSYRFERDRKYQGDTSPAAIPNEVVVQHTHVIHSWAFGGLTFRMIGGKKNRVLTVQTEGTGGLSDYCGSAGYKWIFTPGEGPARILNEMIDLSVEWLAEALRADILNVVEVSENAVAAVQKHRPNWVLIPNSTTFLAHPQLTAWPESIASIAPSEGAYSLEDHKVGNSTLYLAYRVEERDIGECSSSKLQSMLGSLITEIRDSKETVSHLIVVCPVTYSVEDYNDLYEYYYHDAEFEKIGTVLLETRNPNSGHDIRMFIFQAEES